MKKFSSLFIAALVATCAFAVVAATADPPTSVDSDVTIKFSGGSGGGGNYGPYDESGKFHGKVSSKKDVCEQGREVAVKREGGGTVGTDKTDAKGSYQVKDDNVKTGKYFAVAKANTVRVRTRNGHKHFGCAKAESDTIKAP
jgi:hypothetical protein